MKQCSHRIAEDCQLEAVKSWNPTSAYCLKHFRMKQMRTGARRHKKKVPSWQWLHDSWPTDMFCPVCNTKMHLYSPMNKDKGNTISLQHDRDGGIRLICMRCNGGHGHTNMPESVFYSKGRSDKWCPRCKKLLPEASFHLARCRPDGRYGICKNCVINRRNKKHE